jgi:WhiB family redox-sensing transcriptional regulator
MSDGFENPMTENLLELPQREGWMEIALCREVGGDFWHPDEGEGQTYATNRALAICHECPVRIQCLNHAMANNETLGVWGGTTPSERKRMRKLIRDTA